MKIKKILKRIAAPLLCVVLLCCVFALPVSAASDWHVLDANFKTLFNTDLYVDSGGEYETYTPVYVLNYGAGWNIPSFEDVVYMNLTMVDYGVELSPGDVVSFTATDSFVQLYGTKAAISATGSFEVLIDFYFTYDTGESSVSGAKLNGFSKTVTLATDSRADFDINASVTVPVSCKLSYLRFEFVPIDIQTPVATTQFRLYCLDGVTLEYGNPNSPNAPDYIAPDGSAVDDLESTEQQLENNTAEGQETVDEILSVSKLTDTLLSYATGLQFTSRIMLSAITRIPFLNALIWVAMSLGFVASLLGLAGAIVSAADRRAGRDAHRLKGGKK